MDVFDTQFSEVAPLLNVTFAIPELENSGPSHGKGRAGTYWQTYSTVAEIKLPGTGCIRPKLRE